MDVRIAQRITGAERMISGSHRGLDACLGIPGLPQSGTGQVSLFTGVNASKLIAQHFGPYPHSGTKEVLITRSIFHQAQEKGATPIFMNAYPERFFQYSETKNRWSATTLMSRSAGLRLHTVEDVRLGTAITAEIQQDVWKAQLYPDIEPISAETAAQRVLTAGLSHNLILTEYYLTDKAGHAQDADMAQEVISRFDRFACEILSGLGSDDTLVITSDHGNVEDLSVKTHTMNRVLFLVAGKGAEAAAACDDLTDVAPFILSQL
jgi:hypothetical protein